MNSDATLSHTCHRKRSAQRLFLFAVLLANMLYSTFAFAQILGTGQLNIERRSHTATLLENGRVLIVGGDNQNGVLSQAEIFDPVSRTSTLATASLTPRTDHTASRLSDGRVLVIGGRDQTASLDSTEIYNPLTSSFVAGPPMMRARSGHSATTLSNGKILVTGGDLFGSAEIYDPVTQSFSLVTGSLNTPRKFHSAVLLHNGQVMIVGGVDAQNTVLNTAEVFDPVSQTFYLPPTDMQTPRAFATLKLLSDGKVQVIGGDAELSMEVFDPSNGIFIAKALLPPNADLLGATLSTQSRAAVFSPSISHDALLQGILTAEQLSLLDRADHSITELPSRNQALVAGGLNSTGQVLNSAKLVSSSRASVTTDKTDYAPGQIVTISGSGFQPNEHVDIYFHEFPEEYPDVFLSAVANQQGSFVTAEFAPQEIDLGRIFTLTAIGQTSGFTAQTAFKDAKGTNTTIGSNSNPSTVGQSVTFTATIRETGMGGGTMGAVVTVGAVTFREGGNNCNQGTAFATNVTLNAAGQATATRMFSTSGNRTIRACYTGAGSGGGATSDSDTSLEQVVNAAAATTTAINAPTITYNANGSVTVTVSSAVGTPTGNVTLAVDGGTPVSKVLSGGSATFTSTDIAALTSPNAGDHSLSASYAAQGNFAASSATGNLHVNQASSTTTVIFEAGPYTYRGTAFTATAVVTGVGGLNQAVAVVYSGDCTNVTGANGCTATATFAGDTNHNGSSDSKSITINKANQAISVTTHAPSSAIFNTTFNVAASGGGSGNAVVITTSGVCLGSGNNSASIIMTSGTGTCTVKYNQAGNNNYHAAPEVLQYTTAEKATATVNLSGVGTYVYDGTAKVVTATTAPSGLTIAVTYNGSATAPINVGTYTVVGTISDLNYQGFANGTLVISAWTLSGFYQPVDMSSSTIVYNSVKGGSTVPLKFKIFAGSIELMDVSAVKSLSAMSGSCGGGMDIPIDELSATGGTSLRYDTTGGQFIFNWQTPKGANNCYKVTMTTQDGSALSAYFKTK